MSPLTCLISVYLHIDTRFFSIRYHHWPRGLDCDWHALKPTNFWCPHNSKWRTTHHQVESPEFCRSPSLSPWRTWNNSRAEREPINSTLHWHFFVSFILKGIRLKKSNVCEKLVLWICFARTDRVVPSLHKLVHRLPPPSVNEWMNEWCLFDSMLDYYK